MFKLTLLMKMKQGKLNRFIKSLALLLSLTLTSNTLSLAFESTIVHSLNKINHLGKPITIPEKFGTIEHSYQGKNRMIVCVQDLHCHYEVQKNIANIIKHLNRQHQLQLIGEEGGFGNLDINVIRDFPLKDVREEVSDYYVRKGRLTGAEYFAANHDQPITLRGIEDQALYQSSYTAIQSFLNAETQGYCLDLREALEKIKPQVYSPALWVFDKKRTAYHNGELNFLNYAVFIKKAAQKFKLSLDEYNNLNRFLEIHKLEFSQDIEPEALFKEIDQIDSRIRANLYTNQEQKELDALSRRLDILEKLLNISVTPEELSAYRDHPELYQVNVYLEFIQKYDDETMQYFEQSVAVLQEKIKAAEDFYKQADQRSTAFVNKMVKAMDEQQQSIGLMVSGGFHIDKIMHELQTRGLSYVTVKPQMTRQDIINPYFDLLQGKKSSLERLLAKNQSIYALPVWMEQPEFQAMIEAGFDPYAMTVFEKMNQSVQQEVMGYFNNYNAISLKPVSGLRDSKGNEINIPDGTEVFEAAIKDNETSRYVVVTGGNVRFGHPLSSNDLVQPFGGYQIAMLADQDDPAAIVGGLQVGPSLIQQVNELLVKMLRQSWNWIKQLPVNLLNSIRQILNAWKGVTLRQAAQAVQTFLQKPIPLKILGSIPQGMAVFLAVLIVARLFFPDSGAEVIGLTMIGFGFTDGNAALKMEEELPLEEVKTEEVLGERPGYYYDKIKGYLNAMSTDAAAAKRLFIFLNNTSKIIDEAFWQDPVESKYPIKKALSLLSGKEKKQLAEFITKRFKEFTNPSVPQALLLELNIIPEEWAKKHTAHLKGRKIYTLSPEITYIAGGLGYVQQVHMDFMKKLLEVAGADTQIATLEPRYKQYKTHDGKVTTLNYFKHGLDESRGLTEVGSFPIDGITVKIMRGYRKDNGMEVNLLDEVVPEAEEGKDPPKAKHFNVIYDFYEYSGKFKYRPDEHINPSTWEEFSAFYAKAGIKAMEIMEEARKKEESKAWKAPLVWGNDAQTAGFFPKLRELRDQGNAIFKNAYFMFTTHTYGNRQYWYKYEQIPWLAKTFDIPRRFIKAILCGGNQVDLTSLAVQLADFSNTVSRKQRVVLENNAWDLDARLKSITNADDLARAKDLFNEIYKKIYGEDCNFDNLTPKAVEDVKRRAKEELAEKMEAMAPDVWQQEQEEMAKKAKADSQAFEFREWKSLIEEEKINFIKRSGLYIDPKLPIAYYAGRLVEIKAGVKRAFTTDNLYKLLKQGNEEGETAKNIVIFGRVQSYQESWDIQNNLKKIMKDTVDEPGNLAGVWSYDDPLKLLLLLAGDLAVLDSDDKTGTCEYTEVNASSLFGLVLSPPFELSFGARFRDFVKQIMIFGEGIIGMQGIIRKNEDDKTWNTVMPKNEHPDSYLGLITEVMNKIGGNEQEREEMHQHMIESFQLSGILDGHNTGATYLEEWNDTIGKLEAAREEVLNSVDQFMKQFEKFPKIVQQIMAKDILHDGSNINHPYEFRPRQDIGVEDIYGGYKQADHKGLIYFIERKKEIEQNESWNALLDMYKEKKFNPYLKNLLGPVAGADQLFGSMKAIHDNERDFNLHQKNEFFNLMVETLRTRLEKKLTADDKNFIEKEKIKYSVEDREKKAEELIAAKQYFEYDLSRGADTETLGMMIKALITFSKEKKVVPDSPQVEGTKHLGENKDSFVLSHHDSRKIPESPEKDQLDENNFEKDKHYILLTLSTGRKYVLYPHPKPLYDGHLIITRLDKDYESKGKAVLDKQDNLDDMLELAKVLDDTYLLTINEDGAGSRTPNHFRIDAIFKRNIPLPELWRIQKYYTTELPAYGGVIAKVFKCNPGEKEDLHGKTPYPVNAVIIEGGDDQARREQIMMVIKALKKRGASVNAIRWTRTTNDNEVVTIFPRWAEDVVIDDEILKVAALELAGAPIIPSSKMHETFKDESEYKKKINPTTMPDQDFNDALDGISQEFIEKDPRTDVKAKGWSTGKKKADEIKKGPGFTEIVLENLLKKQVSDAFGWKTTEQESPNYYKGPATLGSIVAGYKQLVQTKGREYGFDTLIFNAKGRDGFNSMPDNQGGYLLSHVLGIVRQVKLDRQNGEYLTLINYLTKLGGRIKEARNDDNHLKMLEASFELLGLLEGLMEGHQAQGDKGDSSQGMEGETTPPTATEESPGSATLASLLDHSREGKPWFESHPIGKSFYGYATEIFGSVDNLIKAVGRIKIMTGPRFVLKDKEATNLDVLEAMKETDFMMELTIPRAYQMLLEPKPQQDLLKQLKYAYLSLQLRIMLFVKLWAYSNETRQMKKDQARADMETAEAFSVQRVMRLPIMMIKSLGKRLMSEELLSNKQPAPIGISATQMNGLVEYYRQMIGKEKASLRKVIEGSLEKLYGKGHQPSIATVVEAVEKLSLDQVVDPATKAQVASLQQTLAEVKKNPNKKMRQLTRKQIARLVLGSQELVNRPSKESAIDIRPDNQVTLMISDNEQKNLLEALNMLADQSTGRYKEELGFILPILQRGSVDPLEVRRLLGMLNKVELPGNSQVVAELGETVYGTSSAVLSGQGEIQKINYLGKPVMVFVPTMTHAITEDAEALAALQENKVTDKKAIVMPYTGDSRVVIEPCGHIERDLGLLYKSSLFKEALQDSKDPLAQAYYQWYKQPRKQANQRALTRVMFMILKAQARKVDENPEALAEFRKAMEISQELFKQSKLFKQQKVVLGHIGEMELVIPATLRLGGQMAAVYLARIYDPEFVLNDNLEMMIKHQQLKNFRMSSAA